MSLHVLANNMKRVINLLGITTLMSSTGGIPLLSIRSALQRENQPSGKKQLSH